MGRRRTPGLTQKGTIWHIDKEYRGRRICRSTRSSSLLVAEQALRDILTDIDRQLADGRPTTTWRQVATKYLVQFQSKASIKAESYHLEDLDTFLGDLAIQEVHDNTLEPFIAHRRAQGIRTSTINRALEVVRRIVRLCEFSWKHPSGKPYLDKAPKITMQKPAQGRSDARQPYPLDWDEQQALFQGLAPLLAKMALYKVNTGNREAEVCGLKWEWEWHTKIPELKGRIFIIPGDATLPNEKGVKNRQDRLVVLNDIAKSVVESCRGDHPDYVFVYTRHTGRGKNRKVKSIEPVLRMNNSSWKKAWKAAGLPTDGRYKMGVHNLKHTFGRRLRAAGVSMETRKVLLGHKNSDITTHYSVPEVMELLQAANKVCRNSRKSPELSIVKLRA